MINLCIVVSQTNLNQILYQFWLKYLLFSLIKKINPTNSHSLTIHFYLRQYLQYMQSILVNTTFPGSFILNKYYFNDTTFSYSYNDTSNQCNIPNTEISVAFWLDQYMQLRLLKSDLFNRIRVVCNV